MKCFIIIVIVVISNTFLGVAKPMKNQAEIYFAGGCFWGTEHFLKQIRGVESTQVGYANSNVANPSYEQVCSGKTNRPSFHPTEILFRKNQCCGNSKGGL